MATELHLTIEDVESCSPLIKPYLRLWASVMRLGISDYCTARAAKRPAGDPAVVWFNSDEHFPGSFTWLCEMFSISPERARSQVLLQWRDHVDRRQIYNSRKNQDG